MATRAAVVIGINYETQSDTLADEGRGTRLTSLRFAEADAQAVTVELEQAGYIVTPLLGAQATREAITDAIVVARRSVGPDGLLVLHFSGHGDVDPDDDQMAYLLPVDTNPRKLLATAIPLSALVQQYLGRVQTALALLDCCHSGWALGWKGSEDRGDPFRRQALETFRAAQGRVVLTACPGEERARELRELRHGVFTHYLLKHWRTHDDEVTAESLFASIDKGLEQRGLPRPVMGGTHQGRLTLRPARSATTPQPPPVGLSPAEVERRERLYLMIKSLGIQRWLALLEAVGEDLAELGGETRAAQVRRLILKLAGEGLLGVLDREAQQQQIADLVPSFEAAQQRDDWSATVTIGEQILNLDPQHNTIRASRAASVHWERGVSYRNQGEYERARADFTRAIILDPQNARYYWDRAFSYYVKGEYEFAITDYTHAIRLDPQQALYYFERGLAYGRRSNHDRAIADYTQAIDLEPENAFYYDQRGVSYELKGEYEHTLTDKSRAIELDPHNGEYYYSRGLSYKSAGDLRAAQADLERAVALGYEKARKKLTGL